ncbi:uncharacterized protein LOC124373802 isoform X1 [Homalodisca vitripennis]|uniref:uncharacterized protein LOC124373802 isoform X1 n=1 Tax=Homalodisca vitripennis TaxID=197043 RepID=UPI001EE9D5A4|nr:uncharacterized protein LOC124373802 isoform X1 [Homalodisca vitripennis]
MVDFDLHSFPIVDLKAIFGVHFILITWGIQGHWSPDSYLFYNLLFLLTLLWSLHCKDRVEPLQMAIVIDGVSVPLDIISMALYWGKCLPLAACQSFTSVPLSFLFSLSITSDVTHFTFVTSHCFCGYKTSHFREISKFYL